MAIDPLNPTLRAGIGADSDGQSAKYAEKMKELNQLARSFTEASKKARETKKDKKKAPKKGGVVKLSNYDSVSRCKMIKAKLNAKLSEILGSSLDYDLKMSMARNVMVQIDKVEMKIVEIKRREQAVLEEKKAQREEKIEDGAEKRKRREDMKKRETVVRRDYLYSAQEGGLDPESGDYAPAASPAPASGAASMPVTGAEAAASVGGDALAMPAVTGFADAPLMDTTA